MNNLQTFHTCFNDLLRDLPLTASCFSCLVFYSSSGDDQETPHPHPSLRAHTFHPRVHLLLQLQRSCNEKKRRNIYQRYHNELFDTVKYFQLFILNLVINLSLIDLLVMALINFSCEEISAVNIHIITLFNYNLCQ